MTPQARPRVLFVCIGNSCRSQMAEAFARVYGSDVLIPASAGIMPAIDIAPDTLAVMDEKGINLRDQFPKSIAHLGRRAEFELIVNMSGFELPEHITARVEVWDVDDPICLELEEHREVRDLIERRVMELILKLREASKPASSAHP